ncbi:amidohydrolase family protein [Pelagibacterium montanilacus]|uniref:amidohydrolase family protein n=1 Tax=Pelagibacterium montanilacus TaxID=2185280 RepID=UPI0013E0D66B|nr:amidohydrolase family protein [Pelagibacterium montanilacus]
MDIVAVEEHFWSREFAAHFLGNFDRPPRIMQRLEDFMTLRLEEMDAAGIGTQVISHAPPGGQKLAPETCVAACRGVNDTLASLVAQAPERFAAFATLPQAEPEAAADELQRAVEDLGFKGAMMFGPTNGMFSDEKPFWPIYERAARLKVPVYLHPALPDKRVSEVYYATYAESHPDLLGAAWGFGIETGTLGVRMVLSGVFDAHPDLQIILGHLGEGIPLQLSRIDESLKRPANAPTEFAKTFRNNFFITTSGFFSDSALRCCIEEMGADRILFAVDWPFVDNAGGVGWLKAFPTDPDTRAGIFSGNARKLLRL